MWQARGEYDPNPFLLRGIWRFSNERQIYPEMVPKLFQEMGCQRSLTENLEVVMGRSVLSSYRDKRIKVKGWQLTWVKHHFFQKRFLEKSWALATSKDSEGVAHEISFLKIIHTHIYIYTCVYIHMYMCVCI